jgi:hypothetical protein
LLIQHISSHILFDNSLDKTLQLCGLCFRPSPTCVIYLRKGKGSGSSIQVDLKRSRCPNLQKFSYQHAATGAPRSPAQMYPSNAPYALQPLVPCGNIILRHISQRCILQQISHNIHFHSRFHMLKLSPCG